ncbi:MAG: methylmalonyl-CoA mutase [Acidobacteriota bacterium]
MSDKKRSRPAPPAPSGDDGRSTGAQIRAAAEGWERTCRRPALERVPERREAFATTSDLDLPPLVTPADGAGTPYLERLGFPGQYPFTRGVQPTMYRARHWTMRQYAGFGSAEESNARYRHLLAEGTTGLSVAFDLPTQMGYDSDHAMATGEVGRVGVAIDSLADMEILFEGIALDQVSTSMTINATAPIVLCLYLAVAKKNGVSPASLRGTIQNDILKEYAARGTFIFPPRPSLRLVTDTIMHCADHLPRWHPISVSGYHIREAGSTAVQEVAFTLANGVAYAQEAIAAGLPADRFGRRVSFFFNAHSNLLEEVAKFRAARRLWARLMRDRFGATRPEAMKLRFHTQTAGSTLTAQQPENNLTRVALQALAAVLGGTQSLHTNGMDEALGLPTKEAATLALRTQQVIAFETGVADTVDPLGESYVIEKLTDDIETAVLAYLDKIETLGGAVAAIESGFIQREIADAAYRAQQNLDAGESVVVGVNRFRDDTERGVPVLEMDGKLEARQVARTRRVRAGRDAARVDASLARLRAEAAGTENLLEPILECVTAYATLGEIAGALAEVFGRHRDMGAAP